MGDRGASRRAGGPLLAAVLVALGVGRAAHAQAPPPVAVPAREAALEARLRRLEAQAADLSRRLAGPTASPPGPSAPGGPTLDGSTPDPTPSPAGPDVPVPAGDLRLRGTFGPGFEFKDADGEYQLQFHSLTQVDGRFFQQGGQDPVHDTFAIPRQWLFFNGRLTKNYEYLASFANGFGNVTILDVYLNFHLDDRLQFKVGRYFVPFTYEPYILPIHALITPEFSLFFNNFEPNRDLGAMAWGQLARKRLDYAAGIFNGTKQGFLDTNDAKDFIGFVNVKPFLEAGPSALENLNLGGSVEVGRESNAPIPQTLRTIVSIPGNATFGVPFLTFHNNVLESGGRALWSAHAAYFYRHLSLIGEVDGGFQDYTVGAGGPRTRLPLRSFYVAAGYFLTGETVASRGAVKPLRPFDLRKGHFGPGAIELGTRYNFLGIGGEVFSHGLADPNLWTDRVATVDAGVNWYLNQHVKLALFWEHAEFGRPVPYRAGASQLTSDLFLLRFQLRF